MIFLPGEDPEAYKQLRQEFFDEFTPSSRYEKELVERLVSIVWRPRRIPNFETALLDSAGYLVDLTGIPMSMHTVLWLGRAARDTLDRDWFAKLSRYERRLMRQYKETLAEREAPWTRAHGSPPLSKPAITIDHDED